MSDRTSLPASTRKKIEIALDRLIDILDKLEPDPDLEEDDPAEPAGDEEPSLGATHASNQEKAWRAPMAIETDLEFDGDTCADAEKEPDVDAEPWLAGCPMDSGQDLELDPADEEPSLGATHSANQEDAWRIGGWNRGADLEFDGETAPSADSEPDADREPWLAGLPWEGGDDREFDEAERGIGDMDGAMEQYGIRGGLGERVEQ